MQVISIISKDGFLSNLNISIPTNDFIEKLHDLPKFWYEARDGILEDIQGNWTQKYPAKYSALEKHFFFININFIIALLKFCVPPDCVPLSTIQTQHSFLTQMSCNSNLMVAAHIKIFYLQTSLRLYALKSFDV